MNRERIANLFADVDIGESSRVSHQPLSSLVSSTLRSMGVSEEDDATASAAVDRMSFSFANLGLGVGFASWVLYQASSTTGAAMFAGVDVAFAQAEKWSGFVTHMLMHPEDWADAAHVAQQFFEAAATLPHGTMEVIGDMLNVLEQGGSLTDFIDAIEVSGHVADLVEGVFTLGLSLLLSYGVGKIADWIIEDRLQPLREKLLATEKRMTELLKLRQMLALGLPAPAITPQLEAVGSQHWGF